MAAKKMCKWKKRDIKDDFSGFAELVRKPAFACRNCGRVATARKHLCKPKAL